MFNIPIEIFSNYRFNFNDKALAGMPLILSPFYQVLFIDKIYIY